MTINECILRIDLHPSGLFKLPKWDDSKDYPRRLIYGWGGRAWVVERNLPDIGWQTAYSPDDHEAHCLVEHAWRETLAAWAGEHGWCVDIRSCEQEWQVYVGIQNRYGLAARPTGFYMIQRSALLDALLTACEAVLKEWDSQHKEPDRAEL